MTPYLTSRLVMKDSPLFWPPKQHDTAWNGITLSSPRNNARTTPSAGTVFWDAEGCLRPSQKGNCQCSLLRVQTLQKPRHAVSDKRPIKGKSSVNALSRGKTEKFGWKVLPHPPYSPNLAPLGCYLFRPLDHMRGQHYENDEAVQPTVRI
jgi:hypothetical protein